MRALPHPCNILIATASLFAGSIVARNLQEVFMTDPNINAARIVSAVNTCRNEVLDAVEQEAGKSERWEVLRKRILKAFGDRGLTGRVWTVMAYTDNEEGDVL